MPESITITSTHVIGVLRLWTVLGVLVLMLTDPKEWSLKNFRWWVLAVGPFGWLGMCMANVIYGFKRLRTTYLHWVLVLLLLIVLLLLAHYK